MRASVEAYKLLHNGVVALSNVERNGFRIDVDRLHGTKKTIEHEIKQTTEELRHDSIWKAWSRTYGQSANMDSYEQIGRVLFEVLKHPCHHYTASGRPASDETALETVDLPFVKSWLRLSKRRKLLGTYIKGIEREVVDGYLHPLFDLHTTLTYRSSSSKPNFQNIPIRDPEIGKIIRECFIPRDGHFLVEMDYAAIEVRVAACYHEDPTMLRYLKDGYDLHRDMGAECYMLDQVPKPVRQQAKALFVFAQFYGDYWKSCANGLWEAIDRHHLKTTDDIPLKKHLKANGIRSLGTDTDTPAKGTFAKHIQEVEGNFWNTRFPVYNRWRRDWYNEYKKKGEFETLTGFVISGAYKRNDVINYPVQGSAFHCLLWSLIQINKWLQKNKMKSKIVGQIHDSIIIDVHESERDDVLQMAKRIMTQDIRKVWKWIITDLEVEAEAAPVGGSWFEKKALAI